MIECAVTISLTPEARGGPFVFRGALSACCAQASRLGFHAIELFPRSAEQVNRRKLKALLERHQLKLAAMGTGAGWLVRKLSLTNSAARVRRDAQQFVSSYIDFASDFGAAVEIGSMQGRIEGNTTRDDAIAWLGEGLDRLEEKAQSARVPLLLEPLNRYETNVINNVADGLALLKSLRTKNVKLLCDLFHMNIEESSIPAALIKAGKRLGHLHWADSNRRAIGFGHTSIPVVVKTLRTIGYSGYVSAEVFPLPSPQAAAKQSIRSFRHFFRSP